MATADDIETSLERKYRKKDKQKTKSMRVSGKSVFQLKKIITSHTKTKQR